MHLELPDSNNEDTTVKYCSGYAVWLPLCLILLCGCASQQSLEDLSRKWIARPLSELKEDMKNPESYASKIDWKETTYPLANGNSVYVEPVRANCFVHWEISESGIIIGYQAKGKACEQEGPQKITDIQNRSE